jgi:hypothetical protein
MNIGKALVADIESLEADIKSAHKKLEPVRKDVEFQRSELAAMEEVVKAQRDKVARAELNFEALSGQAREHLKRVRFFETLVVSGLDVLGLSDPEGICEKLDSLAAMCGEDKPKAPAPAPPPVLTREQEKAQAPLAVLEQELEPAPETEPAPEPVQVYVRPNRKAAKSESEETAHEWVVRMANLVNEGPALCLKTGHSPLQLLAAWAVKELTLEGRSNNYHVVGTGMMADHLARELRMSSDKVGSRMMLTESFWREKLKSAASRAAVSGLPIMQIDYTKASVPKHIGKTGSTKGFEWAPNKSTVQIP